MKGIYGGKFTPNFQNIKFCERSSEMILYMLPRNLLYLYMLFDTSNGPYFAILSSIYLLAIFIYNTNAHSHFYFLFFLFFFFSNPTFHTK